MVLVEFAIVAAVLMTVIFGCIELGRLTFSLAALNEGTRRAARLAAVCPINDPAIQNAVNFMSVYGFSAASNVTVSYMDVNGADLGAAPAANNVYYVSVSINSFQIPLTIPGLSLSITAPALKVTLPAESLGLSGAGVATAC
jgi:Flp pilus assembly protein TadG